MSEVLELGRAALDAPAPEAYPQQLARMGLAQPQGFKEELYQRLLLAGLQATAVDCGPIAGKDGSHNSPGSTQFPVGAGLAGDETRAAYSMKVTTPSFSDLTRASDSTR